MYFILHEELRSHFLYIAIFYTELFSCQVYSHCLLVYELYFLLCACTISQAQDIIHNHITTVHLACI